MVIVWGRLLWYDRIGFVCSQLRSRGSISMRKRVRESSTSILKSISTVFVVLLLDSEVVS